MINLQYGLNYNIKFTFVYIIPTVKIAKYAILGNSYIDHYNINDFFNVSIFINYLIIGITHKSI
jgi:hypothetical protein